MLTEGTAQFPLLVAADDQYLLLRCAARALRVQQLLHKIRVHAVGARQQKRLLEENRHFPLIARPRVAHQQLQRIGREGRLFPRVHTRKDNVFLHQLGKILLTFAQGRQINAVVVQFVRQRQQKFACLRHGQQIPVR